MEHTEENKQYKYNETQINREESKEMVIRKGDALPLREPQKVVLHGTLSAPAEWIAKRIKTVNPLACYVVVNREKMTITLTMDEQNYYGAVIEGGISISEEMKTLGINSGTYLSASDLSDLLKMNLACFENRQSAMTLISQLKNFKAKVTKKIEDSSNTRGDYDVRVSQAIDDCNLPKVITFFVPLLKGAEKSKIEAEVYINPKDYTVTLVSADAKADIANMKNKMIDDVIDRIKKVSDEIAIIEC